MSLAGTIEDVDERMFAGELRLGGQHPTMFSPVRDPLRRMFQSVVTITADEIGIMVQLVSHLVRS